MNQENMNRLLEIGVALSMEKDLNRLLERILTGAMELTGCDAGALYLKDGEYLRFKQLRNHTMGVYCGGDGIDPDLPPLPISEENICGISFLENCIIRIDDVRECEDYDLSGPARYDAVTGYHTQSMLVVPMANREGDGVGVLQLINAKDAEGNICPFPENLVLAVGSMASQAAITIQNAHYFDEIRSLFQSFVRVLSSAIDERTPYNASHTRHMVECGIGFVDYLNRYWQEHYDKPLFSEGEMREFFISVWLHDIGKLTTPLVVMNKEARLYPLQYEQICHRLETIGLLARISCLEGRTSPTTRDYLLRQVEETKELIDQVNTTGFVDDALATRIRQVGSWLYLGDDGRIHPWLTTEEQTSLLIRRGTFLPEERKIMEDHVVITDRLLAQIQFPRELPHVREWAAGHHELLDGSGYPKGLKGDEIPMATRCLTILDVFDALVADDRPYKPGMPVERALSILETMAEKEGKLDKELVKRFVESKCWENRDKIIV